MKLKNIKLKNLMLIVAGIGLYVGTPTGVYFGFRNDERATRVEPKMVEEKDILISRNPFNYYNQPSFSGDNLFNNDNGFVTINGQKERILPYGVFEDDENVNNQQNIILYKVIKDNGITKKPEIDIDDYIKISIKQEPSKDNDVLNDYSAKIIIAIDTKNSSLINPPNLYVDEIRIEDCSSWAKGGNYEEIRFNKLSEKLVKGKLQNNKIIYEFNSNRTGWFGIRIDDYSNKEYIHHSSYDSPVEDLYFQIISPFLTPTIKYDINKSKGNNLDERNFLYNKYVMPGRSNSLITDGESTAYGKLTETIDFREPYIHNNYHVSKMKQDFGDKPIKNEYWNMLNYIIDPNKDWKIELDLNIVLNRYIIYDMNEFDSWIQNDYTSGEINYYELLKDPKSEKFLINMNFKDIVSGKYIFEKNKNINGIFIPNEKDAKIIIAKSNGNGSLIHETKEFEGKITPILKNDGYLSILVEDFLDLNENQVIASMADGIHSTNSSTITIYNDLNNNGKYEKDEEYTLSIEEGSPSTSNKIWDWGGKRYSNPINSKFILDWNNNGPEYWNFYVINPIQITGIILTATLTTMIFYEMFTIANNEKKREKLLNLWLKYKKS